MRGKKRLIELSVSEEAELLELFKTSKQHTFRVRCHYVLLSNQGKTMTEIANIYATTRQTISKWFDRYESEGIQGLQTAKGRGRQRILRLDNETEVALVKELVSQNGQNLKVALHQIEERLGKKMSKRTLKRFLKKRIIVGNANEKIRLRHQNL